MTRANEIQTVRPGLVVWQAFEPAVKVDLSCCAHRTSRGLVLIDPIALDEPALEELLLVERPHAIVLTNVNHARAAAEWRRRFSIPIHAHADAVQDLGLAADHLLADGQKLFEAWEVIALPGAAPGELALLGAGVLHLGDALIHLPPHGLTVLPPKYCGDAKKLCASLGKLLRCEFEILTFAHGLPIVARARQRLSQLLA